MPELTNLKVDKVSLVKHPANQRKFVLLKSRDGHEKGGDIINRKKEVVVKAEILQKVKEILKTEREPAKVIEALKATDLEISDSEVTEVENSLEMLKALEPPEDSDEQKKAQKTPDKSVSKKADESDDTLNLLKSELEGLRQALKDTREELVTQKADAHKQDIISWIERNAPYAPGTPEDLAKSLIGLESADAEAAKLFKDNLVQTSKALEDARVFSEIGSSRNGDVSKSLGGEFLTVMRKARDEVKKGESKETEAEALERAVKSLGGAAFEQYRRDFNRRAKRS